MNCDDMLTVIIWYRGT